MAIEIKLVDEYPEDVLKDLMARNLEAEQVFFHPDSYQGNGSSEHEFKKKILNVAAYDGERLIGLSCGASTGKRRFMMDISLVEKEYRGQGIYTKMLDMILENTREFDEIDSYHHQFNNKIIAKKLRHGFHIVALEMGPAVGPLVKMRYFNNKKLYDIMRFRMGLLKQDDLELK